MRSLAYPIERDEQRILVRLRVTNVFEPDRTLTASALVDTRINYLVLPTAWRDRLGKLKWMRDVPVRQPDGSFVAAPIWAVLDIQIDEFRRCSCEAVLLDMQTDESGEYIPLVGVIPLESSGAAVDRTCTHLYDLGPIRV